LAPLTGGGRVKAVGSVTLGDAFVVHGIRVVDSDKGLFVSMPQRKDGDKYVDVAHPVTADLRTRLRSAVLEVYQELQGGAPDDVEP
jgi:stage V sporulation protein G